MAIPVKADVKCGQVGCPATATAEFSRKNGIEVHGAEGWSWDSIYGWSCPEHPSPLKRAARSQGESKDV